MLPVVSLGSQRHRAQTRALTTFKTDRQQRGSIRSTTFRHVRPPARRSALKQLPGARQYLCPHPLVHGGAYINALIGAVISPAPSALDRAALFEENGSPVRARGSPLT